MSGVMGAHALRLVRHVDGRCVVACEPFGWRSKRVQLVQADVVMAGHDPSFLGARRADSVTPTPAKATRAF